VANGTWEAHSVKHRIPIAPSIKAAGGVLCLTLLAACGSATAQVSKVSQVSARSVVSHVNPAPDLHVSGRWLVGANGQRVVLHGVNRAGGEYECVRGRGIWDGPMNQASVSAMRRWNVNAVRVPLNEACWNGESYVEARFRGANYRRAVEAYVRLLNRNGIVAILDLHWSDGFYSGPGALCMTARAMCQKPMPDAAQSLPFWTSVARTFKGNNAVVFDVFNEPFLPRVAGGSLAQRWQCWLRGGGACLGIGYRVAGMQSLVTAIRSTGASNVIMLGGLSFANDLAGWLSHEPKDPDHNLAASWHSYRFNACDQRSCWDRQVAPVIARVPVIVGEMGERNCSDSYITRLMSWLDFRSSSYLAWSWNADMPCSGGPSLITNYGGTPTRYGVGLLSHLHSLHPLS
jgi:endoglucanase